jgi:2'-5' RNA ligase
MERLFVALNPPESIRQSLAALGEPLPGVAWSRPEQIHLTLRFLGDVDTGLEERIVERLAAIRVEPFLLPVEGLGTFPPKRPPRVVWAGVGSGHPRLYQLRQRLDDALLAAGAVFDVETFHPHFTLARCRESAGPALSQWLRSHDGFEAPLFRASSFDLMSSRLLPEGAEHTLKRRFPLSGS